MQNQTSGSLAPLVLLGVVYCSCHLPAQPAQPAEKVLVKDKVIYAVQGSATNQVLKELELTKDIKVMTNCAFRVKEGKERQLAEGQVLGADGMLTSPDGSVTPVADHVAIKNGRVWLARDGESAALQAALTLGDGSTVSPDGYLTKASGERGKLLDGQWIGLDGRLIPARDTIMLSGGKVRVQKDGSLLEVPAGRSLMMNDGTKVFSDGRVVRRDGTTRKLAEGEILAVEGVVRKEPPGSSGTIQVRRPVY
jgi:hypothetical protein